MSAGDIPSWVAAVAAWASVVVNALIVFVALAPIRSAKRERIARGRLVAAYLAPPMSLARSSLGRGRDDITLLLDVEAKALSKVAALKRLRELPETIEGLLNRFDVSEAAYLNEGMGEKLAQSFGAVNVALMSIPVLVEAFTDIRELEGYGPSKDAEEAIEKLRNVAAPAAAILDAAAKRLDVFTEYCERLGFLRRVPRE